MNDALRLLQSYVDMGFAIIPINKHDKNPLVDWKPYQFQQPTFEQIQKWYDQFQAPKWGVVTGPVSNIMVVDTDTPEALAAAQEFGLTNSCCVSTPHGHHFYFRPPDDDNIRKTIF